MGLLDLPAPILDLIDRGVAMLAVPPGARVAAYGALSGWLCMAIYRWTSRQQDLAELAASSRVLRAELSAYDGPFAGLMERIRRLMRLSSRHLRLSFWPAVCGGLPILFLLPWLSNQFDLLQPVPGAPTEVHAEGLEVAIDDLEWLPPALSMDADRSSWMITWPGQGQQAELRFSEKIVVQLPPQVPTDVLHRRVPGWNHLIGNPAGYLPESAPVFALRIDSPRQFLQPLGPDWLRGWLALYLIPLILVSLLMKWRFKLH